MCSDSERVVGKSSIYAIVGLVYALAELVYHTLHVIPLYGQSWPGGDSERVQT